LGAEELSSLFDELIAVAGVLELTVRHLGVFIPDADDKGCCGFCNASTTAAFSTEVSTLGFGVVLDEHELLSAHSDSCFTWFSVAFGCALCSLELVDIDCLLRSIFQLQVELVARKLEPC